MPNARKVGIVSVIGRIETKEGPAGFVLVGPVLLVFARFQPALRKKRTDVDFFVKRVKYWPPHQIHWMINGGIPSFVLSSKSFLRAYSTPMPRHPQNEK
jgi:hypothetical protein